MNFTGRFDNLMVDLVDNKQKAIFALNEDAKQAFDDLKGCKKLSITIKKYRQKRSLDANAYYWVLITKLAKKISVSNPELHNMMLRMYGQAEIIEGKAVYLTIPDTEEAERKVNNATDYHLQATSQVREGNDGIMYRTYKLLRGSHTYNTEEMARLIDGLVQCCKDAGIPDSDIASPDEKRILKERYGVDIG